MNAVMLQYTYAMKMSRQHVLTMKVVLHVYVLLDMNGVIALPLVKVNKPTGILLLTVKFKDLNVISLLV